MKKMWHFLLAVMAVGLLLAGCNTTLSRSTGQCIVTADGSYILLIGQSPIILHDISDKGDLFTDLNTGDTIQVWHDGINETYPGTTGAYRLKKLESGDISRIPANVIENLSALGYEVMDSWSRTREIYTGTVLEYTAVHGDEGNYLLKLRPDNYKDESLTMTVVSDSILTVVNGLAPGDPVRVECFRECYADGASYRQVIELMEYQDVDYVYRCANMRIRLPADWCYDIAEYSDDSARFGIHFWPESYGSGYIALEYYPSGFGVCGTGLEESKISLGNGYAATQGIYDGGDSWSYITLDDLAGSYVICWEGMGDWRGDYSEEIAQILSTIQVADGCIDKDNAILIAAQASGNPVTSATARFDFCDEVWTVTFDGDSARYHVSFNGDAMDESDPTVERKPVLYLYPTEETEVTVRLDLSGQLLSSYPAYGDGWNVTAMPDGTLIDATGRQYYCLFWEGILDTNYDFSRGFCIPGDETADFLESTLKALGLTDRESNEFIIYWLPLMEGNAYNLISFQQQAYTDAAGLEIQPQPDSILRIFMAWKPLDSYLDIQPQEISPFRRIGFTAVEWGGAMCH